MRLRRLSLRQFRGYEELDLEVPDGVVLFEGANASGKTSLLEAVYYLATLRSFRTRRIRNLIRWESGESFVGGRVEGVVDRVLRVSFGPGRRSASIDGRPIARYGDYYGVFQCVVFTPEDRALVAGGAAGRRTFVDMLLSEIRPGYLAALQDYGVALRSRNALLRDEPGQRAQMASFEEALAVNAARIVNARAAVAGRLAMLAPDHYRGIAGHNESMTIRYRASIPCPAEDPDPCRAAFDRARERDLFLRMTTVGPHRDDFEVRIDGHAAAEFASQGQVRSIVLALRLAEADLLRERFEPPVLLIDDVLGQLDEARRREFLKRLGGEAQVWVTSTGRAPLEEREIAARYEVADGSVRRS